MPKKQGYARIFGPLAQKLAPTATLAGINVALSHVAPIKSSRKAAKAATSGHFHVLRAHGTTREPRAVPCARLRAGPSYEQGLRGVGRS